MYKYLWTSAFLSILGCSSQKEAVITEPVPVEVEKKDSLLTFDSKFSYAIGSQVAGSLEQMNKGGSFMLDVDAFVLGVKTSLAGDSLLISKEEGIKLQQEFQQKELVRAETLKKAAALSNLEIGKKFLDENKKDTTVKVTASGLQYKVLKSTEGVKPSANDTVVVHYTGLLVDSTKYKFDSSYDRRKPARFPLDQVIKGWTEGVQLMSIGSVYRFWIPSEMAYGARGAGDRIGPNSTLMFEIELLEVVSSVIPKVESSARIPEKSLDTSVEKLKSIEKIK